MSTAKQEMEQKETIRGDSTVDKKVKENDTLTLKISKPERERWEQLLERVKRRVNFATNSNVLRDVIYGSHGIWTRGRLVLCRC
jgi:hypothetical protein